MIKYNINMIDPYSVSTVGDLYNLYRAGQKNPQFVSIHQKIVDKIYRSNDRNNPFFAKQLHELNPNELKFVLLLAMDRVKYPKSYISSNSIVPKKTVHLYDIVSVTECFLSVYPQIQYYHPSNPHEINFLNARDILKIVKEKGLGILNDYNILKLRDTQMIERSGHSRSYRSYSSNESDKAMIEYNRCEPGNIVESTTSTFIFRRPFRYDSVFPKIKSNPKYFRIRDLLMSYSTNISNGWLRRIPTKMAYYHKVIKGGEKLSFEELELNFLTDLHKPVSEFSGSQIRIWMDILSLEKHDMDLFRFAKLNYDTYLAYKDSGREEEYEINKSYHKEAFMGFHHDNIMWKS